MCSFDASLVMCHVIVLHPPDTQPKMLASPLVHVIGHPILAYRYAFGLLFEDCLVPNMTFLKHPTTLTGKIQEKI